MQEENAPWAEASKPNDMRIGVPPGNNRLFEFYRWANLPAFEIDACDGTQRSDTGVKAALSTQ